MKNKMKNSTKLVAAAIAVVAMLIGTNVKAQTNKSNEWRLGIGIAPAIPTGNASDISKFALGGDLRLQYGAADNLGITLTSGYTGFFLKSPYKDLPGAKSLGVVPVKVGIKAFFAQNVYFGAEAGAGFETGAGSDTKLLLSPALGWANQSWDVGVKYENYSGQSNNYGLVGLRIAYGFAL